ncbi:MAG: sulfotransferase [Deltaproteobacteria bacterium]|nr:sulfotransferase [Deltaproteobacteria bacterium]
MDQLNHDRLPDFIIIGAMKCGTTSALHILSQHDDVFMPAIEPCFFDVDEIEQHGDFFVQTSQGWTFHDFEKDMEMYLEWYKRFFSQARADQLVGDRTTTYLPSKLASGRIARLLPEVKLVAMLRDPVARAYSHYWHNVSGGGTTMSFADALRFQGGNFYVRGFYEEQLRRYKSFIEAGRLKVIFFEDFVADQQAVVDDLCRYLGLQSSVDLSQVDSHKNRSSRPLSMPLRLLANRVYRMAIAGKSYRNIPNMPSYNPSTIGRRKKKTTLNKLWESASSLVPRRKIPPMEPSTREFLQQVFKRHNRGLAELVGEDVSARWGYMKD